MQEINSPLTEKDHIYIILDGLPEEYKGFRASVMLQMAHISVVEIESYLIAYEEMLNQYKKPQQTIPLANLAQGTTETTQNSTRNQNQNFNRGRGRGGRSNRGGRYNNNSTKLFCQLCNRPGHGAWNCYFRFDQQFESPNANSSQQYQPPAPPPSFHQPRAYLTAPIPALANAWYPDSGPAIMLLQNLLIFFRQQRIKLVQISSI
ncbi:hypothetical protein PIB30_119209 [Stylosanthes scabra]|uniref:Uncharacterized protein n=1 Tax=Stylosanthes scabra TaxID=79078 RepID=A0ABU6W3W8_9FABA|nr:hypothetical protein [Stylosanthes scabra]